MFLADVGQTATSRQRWQSVTGFIYIHQWIASNSKSRRASTGIKYIATGWSSYFRTCQELVFFKIPFEQTLRPLYTSINCKQISTRISIAPCFKNCTPLSQKFIGSHCHAFSIATGRTPSLFCGQIQWSQWQATVFSSGINFKRRCKTLNNKWLLCLLRVSLNNKIINIYYINIVL